MIADADALDRILRRLQPLHAAEVIEGWRNMAQAGMHEALAADLMARHYDPRYQRSRERKGDRGMTLEAADLSGAGLAELALQVEAAVLHLCGKI